MLVGADHFNLLAFELFVLTFSLVDRQNSLMWHRSSTKLYNPWLVSSHLKIRASELHIKLKVFWRNWKLQSGEF